MFRLDRFLEDAIKNRLHRDREDIIEGAIKKYKLKYPDVDEAALRTKMAYEAIRITPIADRSILHERVLRSRYTFWISTLASVVTIGALGGFTSGSYLPFIAPVVNGVVTYGLSMATVGIAYNQRIKGAMDCVIAIHEYNQVTKSPPQQSTGHVTQALGGDLTIQLPISGEEIDKTPYHDDETEDVHIMIDPPGAPEYPSSVGVGLSMKPQ